jgi:hypothetical protein
VANILLTEYERHAETLIPATATAPCELSDRSQRENCHAKNDPGTSGAFAPSELNRTPRSCNPTTQLSPTARIRRALRLSNLRETLFVTFRVLLDGPLNLVEELAVKPLLGDSVAEKKHCIRLSPIFAILPNLHRVAAHLPSQFLQPRIAGVIPITEKYLVVDGH